MRFLFLLNTLLLLAGAAQAGTNLHIGTPAPVTAAGGKAASPDIAVGPNGVVQVIWVEKSPPPPAPADDKAAAGRMHAIAFDELFYRRGAGPANNGVVEAWSKPVRVNSRDGDVWGFATSKPVLSVDSQGTAHVFYAGNDKKPGTDQTLLAARYTRSTDGGASFEPGRTLNSPATNDLSAVMHGGFAAAHAFGTIIANGKNVEAFWIDTRTMKPTDGAGALWRAVSQDGGATFGHDEPVYATNVCPCCQLSAATSGERTFLGTRHTYEGGFRDSAIGSAPGPTAAFGPVVRVGEGQWKIDGCPLKRTAVAADGSNVYSVVYTAGREPGGVYFSHSTDGGTTFRPAVEMHPGAAISDGPTIAAAPGGFVYVAWHGKTTGGRRIFARASTDFGATFSPVTEVSSPEGTAAYPELATAPDGSAWLAWQQDQQVYVTHLSATKTADVAQATTAGMKAVAGQVAP